jgi:hypothetical protein
MIVSKFEKFQAWTISLVKGSTDQKAETNRTTSDAR